MNLLPRSIALRLTLALATIALMVFAVAGVLLHRALHNELARMFHAELAGKIDVVRRFVDEARTQGLEALREHLDYVMVEQPGLRVWLQAVDGKVLYGGPLPSVAGHLDERGHLGIVRIDGVAMEAMEEVLTVRPGQPVERILVALEMPDRDRLLANYRNALIAVCAAGVLIVAALGAAAAWGTLAPLKRLSAQAARITPRSLTSRLSERRVDRELAGLVRSFNGVLDRLEAAYRQMEAFNADAAHELRTPLATLISGNQVILSATRSADELRETLASNLEDLEHLKALVNDMLFLARADRGEMAASVQSADLGIEADKALEYCEPLIDEAGLHVERVGSAIALCNPALIRRAVSNLLTNAIKHTEAGGRITVNVESLPGRARLSVFNPGTAIAPAVAARMFDRFYQGDEARRHSSESHGLGLAIVQAIARMHGGSTFAEPGPQGTRVGFEIAVGGTVAPGCGSA